jgi:hypothetical protein
MADDYRDERSARPAGRTGPHSGRHPHAADQTRYADEVTGDLRGAVRAERGPGILPGSALALSLVALVQTGGIEQLAQVFTVVLTSVIQP